MQVFFDTFSSFVNKDDSIILAVSGGVDSMVMLDLVLQVHPKEKTIIAHFDHSLRGGESDGDREFIANFCNNKNLKFETEKMDITKLADEQKMSIENAARKYRYEFLFRVAEKHGATYILTAHHADDRTETAMFNLIRGTKLGGIHALAQVTEYQGGVKIFRPLLTRTKKEILEYAGEKNIQYREDSSNADTEYLRNHLRKNILPEFEKINPEYRRAIMNFIDYSEELKEWIDMEIGDFLGESHSFRVEDFEKKSPFFQKEVIRYLYEKMNDGTVGLSEGNIEEMRRFIRTAEGGTEKVLKNLVLRKNKNIITLGVHN